MTKKTRWYVDGEGNRTAFTYWQASWEVPADLLPAGLTRKRVTGTGRSKPEALARLKENREAFERGEAKRGKTRLSGKATVRSVFTEWDTNNKAGAVSPTMAWKYEGYFRNHILPHIGDRRLDSLTETDLLTLFNLTLPAKKDDKGRQLLGGPARRNVYMALSGCLKFAVRQHYIAVNPLEAVKPPAKQKPKDDIDTVLAEAFTVLDSIQTGENPDEARWLLAFLGLRRGERLGLPWANVRGLDGDEPTLVINQQLAWDKGPGLHIKPATKSKKPRSIPLTEPWVSALKRHRERWEAMTSQPDWEPRQPEYADLLFVRSNGNVITLNDDNDDWNALLTSLGITPWRAHLQRHITATLLAEMQPAVPFATVSAILGHASEAMSVYYAHMDKVRTRGPMEDYGKVIAIEGRTDKAGAARRRASRKS